MVSKAKMEGDRTNEDFLWHRDYIKGEEYRRCEGH